jgi:hypothetical protein
MFKHFIQWLVSFVLGSIFTCFLFVFLLNVIVWNQNMQKKMFSEQVITNAWNKAFIDKVKEMGP